MANSLEIALRVALYQHNVDSGLRRINSAVKGIGAAAHGATAEFKRLYESVNGFSALQKGLAAMGGTALLRDTENTVLAFQRMQLELKQTAGLSTAQVEQISNYAKESAAAMLSTPTAMLDGALKLANAGEKWENLLPILKQAASDAAAFRATVGEMANMDFDISTKMKIDSSELSYANNMMLSHARSGRFEAPAMSRGAPELFTYASKVGLTGTTGLNLVGAMTQQVMKGIAPDQQTKVLTDFEQGFSHIVTPHYMKGLAKVGIDVQKYMPNGKFYGEGGVQGFTDLVKAMKAKGLEDPFKLADAGFADKETKDFWFQMMKGVDGFGAAMREAAAAAKSGQTVKDRAEISSSAVGQDTQARANYEKRQLDGENAVSVWERLKNKAAENPIASAASVAGIYLAYRNVQKKRQAGQAAADSLSNAASAARGQNVFVMNWPKSLGLVGTTRPNLPESSLPMPGKDGAVPGKEGRAAKLGRYAMYGTAAVSEVAAAGYASYQVTSALMETQTGEKFSGWLADQAAKIMAALGDKTAQQMVKVTVDVQNGNIVASVNDSYNRTARRN